MNKQCPYICGCAISYCISSAARYIMDKNSSSCFLAVSGTMMCQRRMGTAEYMLLLRRADAQSACPRVSNLKWNIIFGNLCTVKCHLPSVNTYFRSLPKRMNSDFKMRAETVSKSSFNLRPQFRSTVWLSAALHKRRLKFSKRAMRPFGSIRVRSDMTFIALRKSNEWMHRIWKHIFYYYSLKIVAHAIGDAGGTA